MYKFTIHEMPKAYELLKKFFLEEKVFGETVSCSGSSISDRIVKFFLENGGEEFLEGPVNNNGDYVPGIAMPKLLHWLWTQDTLFEGKNSEGESVSYRIGTRHSLCEWIREADFYAIEVEK